MYAWSPGAVWALLAASTALLILLPWLPPRRASREGLRMTVHPGNREILVRTDETVLEAGLRAGIPMPFECRNGGCGVCKGTILQGEVRHGPHQRSLLGEDERMLGRALLCVCTPVTDVEVEYEEAGAEKDAAIQTLQVTVAFMRRVAEDVMIVHLKLPEGARLPFRAGQYFNVVLEDGARRAFSFATAPDDRDTIEMHVRLVPGGRFTTHVFEAMKLGDRLTIEGPYGRFYLRESARPLIFVAGATGFAPVKSMLEHAFGVGLQRRMLLYWGARHRRDLYMAELVEQWAREHSNFSFVPVLSEALPEDGWSGRAGLVHEAILRDFPDLAGFDVYTCGSVKMVESARPAFIAQGLAEEACFADAFLPAQPLGRPVQA
jgi:NAD(P)H-flavin reductase/ferredoxin